MGVAMSYVCSESDVKECMLKILEEKRKALDDIIDITFNKEAYLKRTPSRVTVIPKRSQRRLEDKPQVITVKQKKVKNSDKVESPGNPQSSSRFKFFSRKRELTDELETNSDGQSMALIKSRSNENKSKSPLRRLISRSKPHKEKECHKLVVQNTATTTSENVQKLCTKRYGIDFEIAEYQGEVLSTGNLLKLSEALGMKIEVNPYPVEMHCTFLLKETNHIVDVMYSSGAKERLCTNANPEDIEKLGFHMDSNGNPDPAQFLKNLPKLMNTCEGVVKINGFRISSDKLASKRVKVSWVDITTDPMLLVLLPKGFRGAKAFRSPGKLEIKGISQDGKDVCKWIKVEGKNVADIELIHRDSLSRLFVCLPPSSNTEPHNS